MLFLASFSASSTKQNLFNGITLKANGSLPFTVTLLVPMLTVSIAIKLQLTQFCL